MFYIEKELPQRGIRKNSKTFKTIAKLEHIEDVIFYMQAEKLEYISTPYIFTHINLSDGYRVRQTVDIGGSEILTSPTRLRDALQGVEINQLKLL